MMPEICFGLLETFIEYNSAKRVLNFSRERSLPPPQCRRPLFKGVLEDLPHRKEIIKPLPGRAGMFGGRMIGFLSNV